MRIRIEITAKGPEGVVEISDLVANLTCNSNCFFCNAYHVVTSIDEVLREGLGKRRTEAYVAVKRSEAATFASHDLAFECGQHFMKF